MDQGWTQWLLDHYRVPHAIVHNDDIRKGGLRNRFDSLILASQSADSILHGQRPDDAGRVPAVMRDRGRPRQEHTGGIGIPGLAAIESFVEDGGTLIALNAASELPIQFLPIPVRNALRPPPGAEGREEPPPSTGTFYSPGSVLRVTVDPTHPIAFGMPKEAYGFSSGGYAFDVPGNSQGTAVIARYASSNLLASGWLSGERAVLGKPLLVEAKLGKGRVVLFAFRPQHRGQTFGTFKFVLNTIYLASAQPL
jgi:hypothetical protein